MSQLVAKHGCCEEASTLSHNFYIPCNQPAEHMIGWPHRKEGPYRMCAMCAYHNVRNRGAVNLGPYQETTQCPTTINKP